MKVNRDIDRNRRPHKANMVALMRPARYRKDIPRKLKEFGWIRTKKAKGGIRYTSRTWEELSLDAKHIERFGVTKRFKNATLDGVDIGTVFAVPIRLELDIDDLDTLANQRFILITRKAYVDFKQENNL